MRWRANPDAIVQRMGESLVVVNLETDRILELNETAATLFELVSSGLGEQEVETELAARFEVEPSLVRAEMASVLGMLVEEKVVVGYDA